MAISGISQSRPALGGSVTSMSPSLVIAPVNADRPYIMGSLVVGTNPTPSKAPTKAFVGQGANVKGVMCLGMPQIEQRGKFVRSGYNEDYNNMGSNGAFWCALDLAHFDKAKVDALTGNGVLSVDKNGVLSFGEAKVTANTAAGQAADNVEISQAQVNVLNYFSNAILSAIDETISVGQTQYQFKYPKGIGAILVEIK